MASTQAAAELDMAAELARLSMNPRTDRLSAEDFETASIHSAAPSYVSEAPSYHSTIPISEAIPAYSGPEPATSAAGAPSAGGNAATASRTASTPAPASSASRAASRPTSSATGSGRNAPASIGLPPIPPLRRRSEIGSLSEFRIPTWSNLSSNPTARHYHSVASRRVAAAASVETSRHSHRVSYPSSNPDSLGGEEAARRARADRVAAPATGWRAGDEVLLLENERWDWFLVQMRDWDEREQCWKRFQQDLACGRAKKVARRVNGKGKGFF